MMSFQAILTVVCVHGEGDRQTVNALKKNALVSGLMSASPGKTLTIADGEVVSPDEPPDIVVVLRDEASDTRVELPLVAWNDVEMWKTFAGYDIVRRRWSSGAKVKVTFETP